MILLKTVLAAMPTYAMSCFKLLKSLCKQIQSVLTGSGGMQNRRSENVLGCMGYSNLSQRSRGLGFKEIEIFNDALLAKHAWRLLKHPHSLLGQTLLNK